MNVSFGTPGLAYANYQRYGPVVERFNASPGFAGYGITEVDVDGFDGYGFVANLFNVTTARRLKRLKARERSLKKKLKKAKFIRKALLKRSLKVTQREIRQLVAKAKKQIARRKSKGKKISKRLRRVAAASPQVRRFRQKIRRGAVAGAVPNWFMPKGRRGERIARWQGLSAAQRKAAFARFKSRQSNRRAGTKMAALQMLRPFPMPTGVGPMPPGFGPGSSFDQQFADQGTGIPADFPDFNEGRMAQDMADEAEIEAGAEFANEVEAVGEEAESNKLFLYGGLAVAGIAAVYFLNKKKGGTGTGRKRSGRAR